MPTDSGERRGRGQTTAGAAVQQELPCPRCESTNTKFCYYNNYNLSQPRYFCKACRRYWTHGGTLRNVPVGGGCRKNSKRSRAAPNASAAASSGSSSGGGSTRGDPMAAASVYADPTAVDPTSLKLQIPAAPGPTDANMTGNDVSSGGFPSLPNPQQGCSSSGFLGLGGFGFGSASASGFEEMGFGLGRGAWPYQEVGVVDGGHDGGGALGAGGDAVATSTGWQFGGGEGGFSDGDCAFAWPDLGISMSSNGFK